jgi:hypothetical protein
MDKGYEKEKFETIKIKTSVAKRFRNYCRTISKSQSMTLHHMVDFFEINGISPEDNLGDTIAMLKGQIMKRSNAVIAIIKNIEKIHHKPNTAILQSLFEETTSIKKEEDDDFGFSQPKLITENEELQYYKKQYELLRDENFKFRNTMTNFLNKINHEKRHFGSGILKLNLNKIDFDNFRKSNNV